MNFPGRISIVGAGPTGLGAAHLLHRMNCPDWILYEREREVGGLAKSVVDDHGFTWDIGGHVAFSHYGVYARLFEELLRKDGWIEHERESWVRMLDTWVPYPFQNNIHRLPPAQRAKCLEGLLRAALDRVPPPRDNFEKFILAMFGQGIADLFMLPYNFKVWAYPAHRLGAGWIGERVAVPDALRVARNVVLNQDDVSWGPNSKFRFPRQGGTGAIWNALANTLPEERLKLGRDVVHVDVDKRVLHFQDGEKDRYDWLISTMPIDLLARMSGKKDWIEQTSRLVRSSTYIIGVGLKGKVPAELATKCWIYFPENNCPFYRVTHFSLYSPNNVDDIGRHWSLMCEVSTSPEKPVDRRFVVEDTIQGLVNTGLIDSRERVLHTWVHYVDYGYPTPTPDRDAVLNEVLTEMSKAGILSRGRFGAWRYEVSNMDHSFMQGYEAALHLLCGSPELTVWDPNFVNTPHPVLGWNRFD